MLAVLLAAVLGASHAMLPGHGKTVMAAYLAGRRGTRRDALLVGATVTATHTAGVLVLGLVLSVSATVAPEGVLSGLGVASGLLVAGIGVGLLMSACRAWRGGPTEPAVESQRILVSAATATATAMATGTGRAVPMAGGSGGARSSASASPAGWCRARPRCWCCSARSASAVPGSASAWCSATASAWPPR